MANGAWSFPVTSTPSWANRYVPCSVALEHFAPASFSSSANPLPTASTPTTPTTPNTTNRAARYLFMRSVPPCCVLAGTLWQVVSRCNEHSVPTYVPFCSGQSAGHWSYYNFPRELLRTPLLPNLNFRECPKGEVRRIPIPRTPVNKGKSEGRGQQTTALQGLPANRRRSGHKHQIGCLRDLHRTQDKLARSLLS